MKITRWTDGSVLYEDDAPTIRETLEAAVKSGADLQGADLQRAFLQRADLQRANLQGADLQGATMPGIPNQPAPATLSEAAQRTADWLSAGRWLQRAWIETPTGAYAGDCKACLHGAAVYVGGEFGPELSRKLESAGFTVDWNDADGRKVEDVIEALKQVAA